MSSLAPSALSTPSIATYKVYGVRTSSCVHTVLATLEEIGAPYEIVPVSVLDGEHKLPEYMAKYHPFGQIPAFEDGDFILFECRAIARYLALKHADESLYPSDLRQRALIEQWLSVNQSNSGAMFDAFVAFFFAPKFRGSTPDLNDIPNAKEKMSLLLSVLDGQLAETAYLAGEAYSLADLSFFSLTRVLVAFTPGFGDLLNPYPSLRRWYDAVSTRKAWLKIDGKL